VPAADTSHIHSGARGDARTRRALRPVLAGSGPVSRRAQAMLLAGVAMLLAACASDTAEPERDPQSGVTPPGATEQAPDTGAILDLVHPDRGEPSSELLVTDLVVGEGAEAQAGDRVVVHYAGVRWSDGGRFDASWDRGQTFSFALGAGQVIAGWDQGVPGMRVGGRRVLTIPPALAYGDRGAGGVIGPGETLVFVVDLLETGAS
jgi:peptidylprolyl isomerase